MRLRTVPMEETSVTGQNNEVKAYIEVEMKYRLYEGVHVQHPSGKYEYFEFPKNGHYKVNVDIEEIK